MKKLTVFNVEVEKKLGKDKIATKSRQKDFAIVTNPIFHFGGIK